MQTSCLREGDQLPVGFSYELNKKPQHAIAKDKAAAQHARTLPRIGKTKQQPQDQE